MPFFGSDWNDDNYYDYGPIGISSSMKEDIRREREEAEKPYKDDGDIKLVKD